MISVASLKVYPEGPLPSYNWHAVVVEGYWIDDGVKLVRIFDPQEDLAPRDLCALDPRECDNPRFLTYDQFFLSGFEHHTDYVIGGLTHAR